ncbi:Signal transduction histidine kinase [Pseudomonas syringae pv. actinidiae]|uniref:Signal transduction histidine kinase n=1 Tax=Pseudomonas syringae pv. actinidiae TaxID=103796 RepID=A0A2V0Q8M2_PSESF|nr:Signal transduction histidine kinase [Pseudomonas syringae pv. actinidiae]
MRKQVRAHCIDGTDFQRSGQLILACLGQLTDTLSLLQYFLGLSNNAFTDRSQAHGAFAALENKHTQFVFEFFDAHRQRWLADVAAFGRMTKVLLLGERNDVAQFCKSHNVRP